MLDRADRVDRSSAASTASGGNAGRGFLVIGQVIGPRGVRGELKVRPETEDPQRFVQLQSVYLGDGHERFAVRGVRFFGGQVLLQLVGIDDRDAAERWRDAYIWVSDEDRLGLGPDQYYYQQIEGLTAVTTDGQVLGTVVEVLPTGANDVYVVRGGRGEILLPAIKDVIVRVDLDKQLLVVRLMDGLV